MLAPNGGQDVRVDSTEVGGYASDPATPMESRFDPNASTADAVRVTLSREVPTFFGKFLTGKSTTTIVARSTAAHIDLAAFSIGSRLASVRGGLPNAILSGLAGTGLSLSVMDYDALASAQVDVLRFAEALRTTANLNAASFGELLSTQVTLPQMANAMALATQGQAAGTLRALAPRLPNTSVAASRLIDLGPLSANVRSDPANPIEVDAYSFLQALLEVGGRSRYVTADVDLGIPGVLASRLMLAIGDRAQNSPWLSVGARGSVTVRTTQTRFYIESTVSAIGIGVVRVPVFIELAQAQATLSDVSCNGGRSHASATLSVTPSVGEVAIADFDANDFNNFQAVPRLYPARLVQSSVTGFADVKLGGVSAQAVTFSASDIASHQIKSVSTNDLANGIVTSLIQRTSFSVAGSGGLGLPTLGSGAIGGVLGPAVSPLDTLVDQVTALAGVHVGEADTRVNGVRCGVPILVG